VIDRAIVAVSVVGLLWLLVPQGKEQVCPPTAAAKVPNGAKVRL